MYGQPIFIIIDERNKVYNTDFSFDPALEKQRDVFVFQYLVGCRISDLYSMTKRSIIDGAVQYIPRKAFSGNIYDKVQDPNLICPLTGHKEGSKAFNRYRKIDEDTNRKTVSLLE